MVTAPERVTPHFAVITAELELRDGNVCVPEAALPEGEQNLGAVLVDGDCMTGAGIYHGDCVVFRFQTQANNGNVVVARVNGQVILKMFWRFGGRTLLLPVNPDRGYQWHISGDDAEIVGKVVTVVHPVRPADLATTFAAAQERGLARPWDVLPEGGDDLPMDVAGVNLVPGAED